MRFEKLEIGMAWCVPPMGQVKIKCDVSYCAKDCSGAIGLIARKSLVRGYILCVLCTLRH